MLRAGTTAPLIKFPRLIPADPLTALSHQARQGDRGHRPIGVGGQQTNTSKNEHRIIQNEKQKAECEHVRPETWKKVGVD